MAKPVVIAVTNQKGGVGKTTTTVNVAYCLAKAGKRVLLVDFDPQGNATSGLGLDKSTLEYTVKNIIMNTAPLASVVRPTETKNLWIVPATPELANTEVDLASADKRFSRLKIALTGVDHYDYVLIDSPPSLSLLTVNGLIAADYILLPVQAEFYAMEGLGQLLETMKLVRKGMNPTLELIGVLVTMMDSRTMLSKQVLAEIQKHFPGKVFETTIPRNVRIAEAPSHGEPVGKYDKWSKGQGPINHSQRRYLIVSAKKASGLGRGFESLIPTDILDETFDPTAQNEQSSELRHVVIDNVTADSDQPRRHFDDEALEELAHSIREHGIIQPIVVTPLGDGKYQIVAGERRWRAAGIAGLTKVPVIVRTLTEQHKLELALIENLQRRDLNPLETATAYLKLHTQFNLTYEEIGHRVGGKAVSTISNIMRLLQLPSDAKQALVDGLISEGHARQILALNDDGAQSTLLALIIKEGWSVRKTEQYIVGYKRGEQVDAKEASAIKNTRRETTFTKKLSAQLALPVVQKTTAKGGQIIISYSSDDELDQLQKRLS